MGVATVLRLNATRFDFSAMRLCSHHRETVFAFLRRFQFESNSFSCGFRSGECQNSEERAAMIAQAIPTTTVMKRAHSSCMNPPALNTRCKPELIGFALEQASLPVAQTIQCTLRDTCSDLTTSDQTNLSRSKNRTASRGAFSRLVVLPKTRGKR